MARPVFIFGAGATAACGGPITNQILPVAFAAYHSPARPQTYQREDFFLTVEGFLCDNFHLPQKPSERSQQHYPGLPLLLSLLDTALDRGQPFGGRSLDDLRQIRASIEYIVFAVLQETLKDSASAKRQDSSSANPYARLLQHISSRHGNLEPTVVSMNYDLIADNVLFGMALASSGDVPWSDPNKCIRLPNYGCDIRTEAYESRRHDYGLLLKLHGSLNWLYCPNCHRLDIGLAQTGPASIETLKVLDFLYNEVNLQAKYSCQGVACVDCATPVRPVLITPTHKKDYRNPHIAQVWYQAERVLRQADQVFIVGYSLPDDDVEVVYLLKRGLEHLRTRPQNITVVQHGTIGQKPWDHEVGRRYRALFGEDFDWQPGGFESWIDSIEQAGGLKTSSHGDH